MNYMWEKNSYLYPAIKSQPKLPLDVWDITDITHKAHNARVST